MATGIPLAWRPAAPPWRSIRSPASPSRYCPRVLPHSLQRQRQCSSLSSVRAAAASTGSDYQQQEDENAAKTAAAAAAAPSPPKKKPLRLQKTFQHLAQRPVPRRRYLLWASCAVFVFLMRRVIVEELMKWPGFFVELWELLKAMRDLAARLLALHAKDTTTWTMTYFGWAGVALRDLYYIVVDHAPVRRLVVPMVLTTAVVSLGEAVTPSAADQPWIIRLATLTGLGAYFGIWDFGVTFTALALLSVVSYALNRDVVTALLPGVATLVTVGTPIVQVPVICSYLVVALLANWSSSPESREKRMEPKNWKSPTIFVAFSIAIGINLAVSWLRARHLVWLAA